MQVPVAAVKVQLDRTAAFTPPCLSSAHTRPVKGIGAQNTTFWQNALGSFTQTRQHSRRHRHRLDQDEDEYEHEDDEYDEDDRRRPNTETAAPGASSQNGFFFKSSCKALEKLFTLRDFYYIVFVWQLYNAK